MYQSTRDRRILSLGFDFHRPSHSPDSLHPSTYTEGNSVNPPLLILLGSWILVEFRIGEVDGGEQGFETQGSDSLGYLVIDFRTHE